VAGVIWSGMTAQTELTKEYIIELQIAEIDRLRAEVQRLLDWIMGDANAHGRRRDT
jgi:hypothetical protein